MPLPPSFLEELRNRLSVSEVVGRRVQLKRQGREWTGLSPFNKERTPSFTVNDEKGFYHCFSSGKHGDIFRFLMETEGLSFREAVEQLAAQAGLDMPRESRAAADQAARARTLHEAVAAAHTLFREALRGPGGAAARAYFLRRGLAEEDLDAFALGYAPAEAQALPKALSGQGFSEELLIEAGLIRRPEDGRAPYSFFRNRVMFPVADRRGRVVGFGGRILDDPISGGPPGDAAKKTGPKYINSPDTPIFHKGALLYGLDRARTAANQGHTVLAAEGYMDVIALVRAGFRGAVAPLGTAMTEDQIAQLWRLQPIPTLCFDGDRAGQQAAWRVSERVVPHLMPGHSIRVAFLPNGEDPDSLIGTRGASAMRAVLDAALPLDTVIWREAMARHDTRAPEGRAGLKAWLDGLVDGIKDPAVRDFYGREFRHRIEEAFPWRPGRGGGPAGTRSGSPGAGQAGVRPKAYGDRASGSGAVHRGQRRPGRWTPDPLQQAGPVPPRRAMDGNRRRDDIIRCLLALVVNHPPLFADQADQIIDLAPSDPNLVAAHAAIVEALTLDPDLDSASLCNQLRGSISDAVLTCVQDPGLRAVAAGLDPEAPTDLIRADWTRMMGHLEAETLKREIAEARAALARDMSEAALGRLDLLLRRHQDLERQRQEQEWV